MCGVIDTAVAHGGGLLFFRKPIVLDLLRGAGYLFAQGVASRCSPSRTPHAREMCRARSSPGMVISVTRFVFSATASRDTKLDARGIQRDHADHPPRERSAHRSLRRHRPIHGLPSDRHVPAGAGGSRLVRGHGGAQDACLRNAHARRRRRRTAPVHAHGCGCSVVEDADARDGRSDRSNEWMIRR